MIVFRVPVCSTLLISEDQLDPIDRATTNESESQSEWQQPEREKEKGTLHRNKKKENFYN